MLFVIDHTHSAENCPGGDRRPVKGFDKKVMKAAKSSGLKMVEAYVDMPGHHLYFVAEAKTLAQLHSFVSPLLTNIGVTHIHPVTEW